MTPKNIIVNYDDNETKVIEKGLAICFDEADSESIHIKFDMCNIKGSDLQLIVESVIGLAQKLGMFDEEEEE